MKISLFKRNSLVVLVSMGMCGCAPKIAENPKAEKITTPGIEKSLDVARAQGGFLEGWPSAAWWELFEDEQLSGLIGKALEENPNLQKMLSSLGEAQALARKEKGKLYPHLNFNAIDDWEWFSKYNLLKFFAPNVIPDSLNNIDMLFGFSFDLDLFGKNRKTYLSALGQAKAQEAEYAHARLLLTTTVATVYFSLQCNLLRLERFQNLKSTRENLIALTLLRKENALDNDLEYLVSEEPLKTLENFIHTVENKIALDKHLLLSLLGKGPDDPYPLITAPLRRIEIPLPKALSLDLLARRPDLMAELWRIDSAAYAVGAAKASFYPNINLMALGGLESIFWNKLVRIDSGTASIIPSIFFPLYTGGELTANLNAKQKAFEAAIFSYNERVLAAVKEVADGASTLTTERKNLNTQEQKSALTQNRQSLTASRLKFGLDTAIDLCKVDEQVVMEELAVIDKEESSLNACIKLIQALGGGYHADPKPSQEAR